MFKGSKAVRLALPASLGAIGLGYFVAISQLPVFFALKVPLAALPLQLLLWVTSAGTGVGDRAASSNLIQNALSNRPTST